MEQNWNEQLLRFLAESPTAFHACRNLAERLAGEGYTELSEQEDWSLLPEGRYFVRRNGSALIAFRIPKDGVKGFLMMAAHADSPSFKIKEHAAVPTAGMYTRLNVEKYGGMLCASWMDRPLSVAGRAAVREEGRIVMKLLNVDRDLLLIPHVAIHMDRSVNDGKKFDPNTDMLPLFGDAEAAESFDALIAETLGVQKEDVLATDLFLYPRTPGTVWGASGEYLSSPRLDDLQCVFGCTEGFLRAKAGESTPLLCVFDNEEVGSGTKQGAGSSFLQDVLSRICESCGASLRPCLARSFLVSADNAHAVHPNHPEYADRNDRPEMNKGIVVKFNANQRYTTDAVSAAAFLELCRRAEVPTQRFTNRADLPGGSTLGNISTGHVSVDSVDIGLAQLAMHSAYETAGTKDTEYLIRAAEAFFGSAFLRCGDGITLE
ncbi:MAG: M18 family aminopeptidase [Oscillospiraceae bacterium]|nr:M18 family aminopeptidase [Oscillospiraceae bacterium]